ncbi:hypothetical protein [Allopusillimonas ginsengisoli]|uniref:hypothetical protein n=1 Tax=Allopusillimonas ginsengisoli TaxID=453575 RepID=UPI00101F23B8|nr:hypothetical protein [Allopusillimonas ginsengisoli]TEA79504.1 hypothetical protein ERE07_00655 [Allopusillimonas ginsengisoli]
MDSYSPHYFTGASIDARKLVVSALATGYNVTLFDGRRDALAHSTDADAIMAMLNAANECDLQIYKAENCAQFFVGFITLASANGRRYIADYSKVRDIKALIAPYDST